MSAHPPQPIPPLEHSTQPRTYKVSFKSILSLPFRICNPPPAVGKVRSCGMTPLFNVRLEDVLDRKHLPPLGLKDFEEWLLYVEMCPENLYFILWLREYRIRYSQWTSQTRFRRDSGEYRSNWSAQNSSQLAMFYARAKQTFFTPNSQYELNLSSDLLAPFHISHESPHPDPSIFNDVAVETQRILQESLRRFVAAQFNNVGNNRVLCGMIAGVLFCLTGVIPPLTINFVDGNARWLRLAAFPGLWLGLTVFLAALHGVCVGVYIFGDLRQLRKFELTRPPISKPQPLPGLRHRPFTPLVHVTPINPVSPAPRPPRLTIIPPPPSHSLSRTSSNTSSSSSSSNSSSSSSEESHIGIDQIIISPAYYDADAIEGPATSPVVTDGIYAFPDKEKAYANRSRSSFPSTAGFIHPFDLPVDDYDLERAESSPEALQPLSSFDFDALPLRASSLKGASFPNTRKEMHNPNVSLPSIPEPALANPFTLLMSRFQTFQTRCNIEKWRLQPGHLEPHEGHPASSPFGSPRPAPAQSKKKHTVPRVEVTEETVRKRFKLVKAVPAFAVPLTRVLNPIIVRGQWEIVVRSAAVAFLISWIVVGALLAVPMPR